MKRLICLLAVLMLLPLTALADIDEQRICGVWVYSDEDTPNSASLRVFQLLSDHTAFYVGKKYCPSDPTIASPTYDGFYTWEQSEDDYGYTVIIRSGDSVYETLYFLDDITLSLRPDYDGKLFRKAVGTP